MRQAHLGPAARRVLATLRKSPGTIDEVAAALGITENAVRTQIQKLERLGFAVASSRRPSASKPAVVFDITPDGQVAFSSAYAPVLLNLVRASVGALSAAQSDRLLQQCGKLITADFGSPPARLSERISGAVDIVNGLGGDAAARRKGKSFLIESSACPLAVVTAEIPAACQIVESIVRSFVREPTSICCRAEANPRCCFVITPGSKAARA